MENVDIIAQGAMALQGGKAAPQFGKNMNNEQIRKTAEDFEAFFLGQMLQPMFANISPEAPFGGGHAEKMWQGLMVDEMGKAMSRAGGIGLADSIHREILKLQEVQQ